jgi:DNA-binding NarL/FixJ family response regulator
LPGEQAFAKVCGRAILSYAATTSRKLPFDHPKGYLMTLYRVESIPHEATQIADSSYGLSTREFAVLELLVEGLADKEIAGILGVTPFTINKHVGQILIKLDCRSRTGAAVKAIRSGMVF